MTTASTTGSGEAPDLLSDDALHEALPGLLSLATGLTGDPETATDLVAATLTRRRRPVRSALAAELPEPRLRALVVQQFVHQRDRSRAISETGLDALTPRTRAAVVLRDGFQLTALEIAAVLDRPAPAVISDLDAVGDQRTEVGLLLGLAPSSDSIRDRLDVAAQGHRRRHLRVGLLLAVAAVVVAALIAVPTIVLPRLPADPRPAGAWRFSHEIEPPTGWTVESRTISADVETSQIKPPTEANDPYICGVQVYVRGAFRPSGATQPTTFRSRPALTGQNRDNAFLAWEYGDDAWARSYCSSLEPGSDVLRQVGNMVRFRSEEIRLPFTLAAVPTDYAITSVTEYPESDLTEVALTRAELRSDDVNLVISGPYARLAVEGTPERVAGRSWSYAGGVEPRMCTIDAAERTFCVTGVALLENPNEGTPVRRLASRQIHAVVTSLTVADDLGDPDSWPTGSQLPR